jgi:TrmH family RNA methyltransferase
VEERIDSPRNPRVHQVRRLRDRRFRADRSRFVLEGEVLFREAVAAGLRLEAVYVTDAFAADPARRRLLDAAPAGGVFRVSQRAMEAMAETEAPQGILAVAELPRRDPWEALSGPAPLALVLDGVQDPGNVGTLLRAAWAFGAAAAWCGPGTADPWGPKSLRAAAGATFRIAVAVTGDAAEVCRALRARGFSVWGLVPRGGVELPAADLGGAVALAVGAEGPGLSPGVAAASRPLTIPMPGRAESLNAAVAGAVALYEAVRQRAARAAAPGLAVP